MIVEIINKQNDLSISPYQVKELVIAVITNEGEVCDEVAIHFVNVKKISLLHKNYFNDPSATD